MLRRSFLLACLAMPASVAKGCEQPVPGEPMSIAAELGRLTAEINAPLVEVDLRAVSRQVSERKV